MPANPHYGHAPMSPIGRGASPAPSTPLTQQIGTNTHPFNVGVTGMVPVAQVTAANIYVTPVNATAPFDLAFQVPTAEFGPPGVSSGYHGPYTTPAPGLNTGGVTPPATPLTLLNFGGAPAWPAGTYQVAYTYVTTLGETTLSPAVMFTSDGTKLLTVEVPVPTDVTGFVTVQIKVPNLENWHITRYAISCSPAVNVPQAAIYVDEITPTNLLDITALGATNSANSDLYFRPGQVISCQWTQADQGASVVFTMFGEKTT